MIKKDIKFESEQLAAIKQMAETYEEIAASRMQKIRSSVLKNRDFLSGITAIFQQVKFSYKEEVKKILEKKKRKNSTRSTFIQTNGKTICVLLSSNSGLYGNIIKKTFKMFLETIKKKPSDVMIIGKLGLSLFQNETLNKPFAYFDLPDGVINQNEVLEIAKRLIQYENVIVFHGQYESIIIQKPTMISISEDIPLGETQGIPTKYIFEPSLKNIMEVFEKEILSAIFEQTVHESQLAKFASRMLLLDKTVENVKKKLNKVRFYSRKLRHKVVNKKQLQTLSSISLWR